jgi:CheY-like chemotaxis protein
MPINGPPPVVLLAVPAGHGLESQLETLRCALVRADSGAQARDMARDLQPDIVLLAADLPDMRGIDVCRQLRADPRVGHYIPTLIVTAETPTPEQRVAALGAGVWDYLRYPIDDAELTLKLQTYVRAKRNLDVALADGFVDPALGVHSRPVLARRARELGALLARNHGALACVVFTLSAEVADPRIPRLVAGAVRVSDVVSALERTTVAVLAPGADHVGAVTLARRLHGAIQAWLSGAAAGRGDPGMRVGYEAVANLTYSPIDPVELLARAANAVRDGAPEPYHPWVRRSSGPTPALPASGMTTP